MDHFLKVFIECVTIVLLLFMFWIFGREACNTLAPQSGTKPTHPALEGEVLTTGVPRSPKFYFFNFLFCIGV